jgi:hypothetical protein
MAAEARLSRFKVIRGGKQDNVQWFESEESPVQGVLFPPDAPKSLIFVRIPGVSETEFLSLLETAKPSYVFELRSVPRFDIGQLNRQMVFSFFQRERSTYLDHGEFSINEDKLREWLRPTAKILKGSERGPFVFLVSGTDTAPLRQTVYDAFDCADGCWQMYELPSSQGRVAHTS